MKTSLLFLVLLVAAIVALRAQTNTSTQAESNIEIFSDRFEFDSKSSLAVYRGNPVRVNDPKMQLTCQILTVKLPPSGQKIEDIVAEENVVIDMINDQGQKIHGTGDKAVYSYKVTETSTNEIVELTGNPMLETVQGTLHGDLITLDRISNKLRATNSRMIIRPAAAKTNQIAEPKP